MFWLERKVPKLADVDLTVLPDHRMAGHQPLDAREKRFVERRAVRSELVRQRVKIYLRLYRPRRQQSLDLGCKVQTAVLFVHVIERFYAEPVACDEQFLRVRVPDRKGEHTAQIFDTVSAVFRVKMEDRLGIAAVVKVMPL